MGLFDEGFEFPNILDEYVKTQLALEMMRRRLDMLAHGTDEETANYAFICAKASDFTAMYKQISDEIERAF